MQQVEEDVILMCNNAREYNVEGSQIYNDATAIMRFTRQKRVEIEAQFPDVQDMVFKNPSSQIAHQLSAGLDLEGTGQLS